MGCIGYAIVAENLFKIWARAEQTKITNDMVTVGVPLTRQRADDRKFGFRAHVARSGVPDAEGVSSTIRGLGRCY